MAALCHCLHYVCKIVFCICFVINYYLYTVFDQVSLFQGRGLEGHHWQVLLVRNARNFGRLWECPLTWRVPYKRLSSMVNQSTSALDSILLAQEELVFLVTHQSIGIHLAAASATALLTTFVYRQCSYFGNCFRSGINAFVSLCDSFTVMYTDITKKLQRRLNALFLLLWTCKRVKSSAVILFFLRAMHIWLIRDEWACIIDALLRCRRGARRSDTGPRHQAAGDRAKNPQTLGSPDHRGEMLKNRKAQTAPYLTILWTP